MAKAASKKGKAAVAQQTGKRGGASVPPADSGWASMDMAQRVAWVSLHLVVLLVPIAMSNFSAFGVQVPLTYDQFDITKVFVMRMFTLIALAGWSWHILTKGGKIRRTKIDYLILALLAWILLTTFTSIAQPIAVFGKYRRFEGLISFVNYATLFFLFTQFVDRASRVRSIARTLFFSGVIVNGYGVLQYLGHDPVKWGTLPFEANRAFSMYGNPDLLGGFIIFTLAISAALVLSEEDSTWRIVYWVGLLIAVTDWIVAFTRGAWIGGAVALLILGYGAFRQRVKLNVVDYGFAAVAASVAAGLVVVSLSAASQVMNVVARLQSIFNVNDASSRTRFEIWQAAIASIKARPILGYGADTFRLVFPRFKPAKYVADAGYLSVADNVHNYPLQITSALGIPGFLLLYGVFGTAAWVSAPVVFGKGESRDRLILIGFWAAAAGYLSNLMFGISVTGVTIFLWISMAMVLSPTARSVEVRPPRWGQIGLALVVVVVALGLIGNTVYVVADNHYLKGRVMTQGDARVAEIKSAIRLNPYNDMYRAELGLAYVDIAVQAVTTLQSTASQGDQAVLAAQAQTAFENAETALIDVIDFVPWEYDNYVFLVNLYNLGSDYINQDYAKQAIEWGLKGVDVEPNGPAIRFQLARAYIKTGELDKAAEQLKVATELDPRYAYALVLYGDVLRQSGELEAALGTYQQALAVSPDYAGLQTTIDSLEASLAAGGN